MKVKSNRKLYFVWALSLLPVLLAAVFYNQLPDQIPTNWGFDGNVTYGPKSTIWMLSGMAPLFGIVLPLLQRIDPRKDNYRKFLGNFYMFLIVLMLFMTLMVGVTISESIYPGRITVYKVITVAMGALFLLIGNMMPKFKSNFFVGIKNPWTLSNTEVWNRTHRIAGYCWVVGGLLIILMALALPEKVLFAAFMTVIVVMVGIPTVLSYLWYRREQAGKQD